MKTGSLNWSVRVDLNHRPLRPERSALTQAELRTDGGTGGYRDRDTSLFRRLLYHSELQCQNLVDRVRVKLTATRLQGVSLLR